MHVLAITKSLIAISWTEHNRWTSPICAVINVPFNSSFVMQQNNDLGKALFFRVIIQSVTGASVTAPDLRAGAALVVAGLVADGYTTIDSIHYIERGYENFERKMTALGASMQKIPVDDERAVQKFKLKVS